ncbi:MAG: hypothetical protein AAFN77_24100 [Planctomycetota bacterium]
MASRLIYAFIVFVSFTSPAFAQFEELTRLVPADANILVLINDENLMNSEYAKSNSWSTKYEKAFDAGVTVIPPSAEGYLLAGSVDLQYGTRNWEIALIKDKEGVAGPDQVAEKFGGKVEEIAGSPAVILPGDTYLIQFEKTIAGGISPSNRQETSRWIQRVKRRDGDAISEYLKTAARYSNKFGTDIVISLDLQDAMSNDEIKAIAQLADDPEAVTKLLKTTKGVTLGINVNDQVKGKILVDFGEDATPFSRLGKDVVIQALGDFGMMLDDLKQWKGKVVNTRFELEGDLSEVGMRRLLSLVQPTGLSTGQYSEYSQAQTLSDEQLNVRYIRSVLKLQSDFQDRETEAIRLQTAWLLKSIEKIESLSVVGIEDEAITFANELTDSYRSILDIISEEKAYEQIHKANVRGTGYRYYGSRYRGYSRGYSAESARKSIEKRNRAEGARQVKEKLQEISSTVRDFRRLMSQKYEIDF